MDDTTGDEMRDRVEAVLADEAKAEGYKAGLQRAIELYDEANRSCALEGCDRPLWKLGDVLRAELTNDPSEEE